MHCRALWELRGVSTPLYGPLRCPAAQVGGRVRRPQPTPPPPSVVRAPALSTCPRAGRPSCPPPLHHPPSAPHRSCPTPVRDLPPPPSPPPPVSTTAMPAWGWGVSPRLPHPSSATVAPHPPPPRLRSVEAGRDGKRAGGWPGGRAAMDRPRGTQLGRGRSQPGSASLPPRCDRPSHPHASARFTLCTVALAPLAATAGGPPRGGLRDGDDTEDQPSRRPPRIRSSVVRWARHVKSDDGAGSAACEARARNAFPL